MIVFGGFGGLLISSVFRLFLFKQVPSFAFLLGLCIIVF